MSKDELKEAIREAGGQAALARHFKISPASVNEWFNGERPFPSDRCIGIEEFTNGAIRCEDMRPDINWAYLRQSASEQKAAA